MMDYKKMTEIVTREVEAKQQKKKKRIVMINRVSLTVTSMCAVLLVCISVWRNDGIKKALQDDITVLPPNTIVTDVSKPYTKAETTVSHDSTVTKASTSSTGNAHSTVTKCTTVVTERTMVNDDVNTKTSSAAVSRKETARPSVTSTVRTHKTDAATSATTRRPVETSDTHKTTPVVTTSVSSSVSVLPTETTPASTTPPVVSSTVSPRPDKTTTVITDNEQHPTTTSVQETANDGSNSGYGYVNVRISFVDDESFESIGGIRAKLIEQQIEWIDDEHYIDVGKGNVICEWNTSVTADCNMSFLRSDTILYRYTVIADELPQGYSFNGNDFIEYYFMGYFEGTQNIEIMLSKEESNENSTPLNGTYSLRLKVSDILNDQTVQGLDCILFCLQTNEVVYRWNTSDNDEIYVDSLEYSFDKPDSYKGNISYAIRITNLPENYRFYYGKSRDYYGIAGFGLEEFENGTDLSCTAYLENTEFKD